MGTVRIDLQLVLGLNMCTALIIIILEFLSVVDHLVDLVLAQTPLAVGDCDPVGFVLRSDAQDAVVSISNNTSI